ncbi:ABC transporter ATP-binding protein [Paraburkholderia bannensis]|uniref:ABC transporter ATP-binding protein n=1 Tax=Paraburkholderia bannensis TaxID=765414 RepID=UPI002AB7D8D2|nr:ABC transporter ATP-binding protein [Paraburkholderia bannensis]
MLEISNLSVFYGRMQALKGTSVSVKKGEVVCVIGPNGAGKSTLMSAVAGGVRATGGTVELAGKGLVGLRPEKIATLGVSLVPEGRHIFGTLTVEENMRLGGFLRKNKTQAKQDLERAYQYFPRLKERQHFPAGRLSGGEQQMLAIARALMTRPTLMMLDEPSLGLAPKVTEQIYEIVLELRKSEGMTLFINEQNSNRILNYADRIYVLRGGEIQLEGRASDLQDGEAIRQAYFGFESHDA